MSKLVVLAVYDEKAAAYATPFFQEREELAMRIFAGETLNPESNLGTFPHDYSLYKIGDYDTDTAELTGHAPKIVITGVEAKTMMTSYKLDTEQDGE